MGALGRQADLAVPAVLSVWSVESSGCSHTVGRAVIRFENHLLWEAWGRQHPDIYDAHFRFGGHGGQTGRVWERHEFCKAGDGRRSPCHVDQACEYRVLALARTLAGDTTALSCISIGGPQILVSHYATLGRPLLQRPRPGRRLRRPAGEEPHRSGAASPRLKA